MKPFKHQSDLLEQTGDEPFYAIFWEQGTGKTKATLDTALHLYSERVIDAILVIAPNGVHRNWVEDELPKHGPGVTGCFWETGKSGTIKHRKKLHHAMAAPFPLIAMGYHAVMTERGHKFIMALLKSRKVMMVLDESTAIKTPKAKRTKRLVAIGKYAVIRRILTGTPITNSPFDLFAPFRFLDPDFWRNHGFTNFTVFKQYFGIFVKGVNNQQGDSRPFEQCVGYRSLPELTAMVAPWTSRVTKDEVLDLPPKLYAKRYFDLSAEQRRVYAEIRDEALTLLEHGGLVTAPLAIVRLLRLHQVTSGYIPTDDGEPPIVDVGDTNPRLECLSSLLEEVSGKAIIWARFRRDIDLIMERLGERAVRYDGAVSDDDRARNKLAFQEGDAQFFVGNTAAAGKGLTLTAATTVIYYNNDFHLENRLQSEDRAHRIGQHHPVEYVDIMAPGTVDEHIVRALRSKVNIASAINGDSLKEWI